jgi:hypothetical protein
VGPHERDEPELERVFRFCCAKHFTTLTDGKAFRCPFAANAERLRAVPHADDNYISLRGAAEGTIDVPETRRRLRHYLREIPYISACNNCAGRTYGDPEIVPGIQTKKPLPYVKYERSDAETAL